MHYEVDTKYGRLVCEFDPSSAIATDEQGNNIVAVIKALEDRFKDEYESSKIEEQFHFVPQAVTTEEERIDWLRHPYLHLQTSAAWVEFTNGLSIGLGNAISQWFEVSILAAKIQCRVPIRRGGGAGLLTAGLDSITGLVRQQVEERLKSPHISWKPLMNLPFYYYADCLPAWKQAKDMYNKNKDRRFWRSFVREEYPELPEDLIEWLEIPKEITLGVEAFRGLSDDARDRLDKKLKEGYLLSGPSQIALEHAARLCGCAPYEYSVAHLRNSLANYYDLAVRSGLKSYLKNAGLPVPKKKGEEKN